MKCPHCGYEDSKVIDSRPVDENSSIKRRRECLSCCARFTTFETVETIQPMVVKKDGSREYFDKSKLLVGIIKACQKRPVNATQIAKLFEPNKKPKIVLDEENRAVLNILQESHIILGYEEDLEKNIFKVLRRKKRTSELKTELL